MFARSSPFSIGLAISGALAACADGGQPRPAPVMGDVGDVTGVEELASPLTALATPCTFAAISGVNTMTIALADGETGVVSKRALDSAILVNGTQCGTATSATVKRIVVTGSSGTNTFILDYINGTFAPGYGTGSGTAGVAVDLVSGSNDAVKIRGSGVADTFTVGADGLAINTDTIKDITVANVDALTVTLGAGNDVFSASGGYGTGATYATAITVYGGDGNDIISGGTGADTLSGGPGNDTLRGAVDAALDTAADTLNGDEGDDTFDCGNATNGGDTFNGGAGTDTVSYALRTTAVTVTMGAGANDGQASETDNVAADVEAVVGGSGNDSLTGSGNDDTISGGAGDDTITGGAGDDTLNGGDGDDTFVSGSSADGADTFNGGAGIDTVSYSARTVGVTVSIDGVNNDGETDADEGDDVKADVEDLIGSSDDDVLTGSASANNFVGGDGDDVMDGAAGNDTFDEEDGDSGSDRFIGGAGTDTVDYSARTVALIVTMDGVDADDGESGEADDVEDDVENLLGGAEADTITGNDLANEIDGGAEDDVIAGGAGNDTLFGGAGVDEIDGGAGDDLVDGGAGTDTPLTCGSGDGDIIILGSGESATGCEL